MPKPRPWPTFALWARRDALDAFRQIDALCNELEVALRDGNTYKLELVIAGVRNWATRGTNCLVSVEGDLSGVCVDCPKAREIAGFPPVNIIPLRTARGGREG